MSLDAERSKFLPMGWWSLHGSGPMGYALGGIGAPIIGAQKGSACSAVVPSELCVSSSSFSRSATSSPVVSSEMIFEQIFTACSEVAAGYVFTGVCSPGGDLCPSMHHRSHDQVCLEGLCPGGLFWRVSVRETPPYGNERVVRILLECILVFIGGSLESP